MLENQTKKDLINNLKGEISRERKCNQRLSGITGGKFNAVSVIISQLEDLSGL